jgi:hypothetical protein
VEVVRRVPMLTSNKYFFVPTYSGWNWLFHNMVIDTDVGMYSLLHTAVGIYIHISYHDVIRLVAFTSEVG